MGNFWSYFPELKFDFLGEHFENTDNSHNQYGRNHPVFEEIESAAIQVRSLCEEFNALQEAYVMKNKKVERLERALGFKNRDIKKLDQEVWELRVKMLELSDQMEKINRDSKLINEKKKNIRLLFEENHQASKENTMGMIKTKNRVHGTGTVSQVKAIRPKTGASSRLTVLSELPEFNSESLGNVDPKPVSFNDISLALNTSF